MNKIYNQFFKIRYFQRVFCQKNNNHPTMQSDQKEAVKTYEIANKDLTISIKNNKKDVKTSQPIELTTDVTNNKIGAVLTILN